MNYLLKMEMFLLNLVFYLKLLKKLFLVDEMGLTLPDYKKEYLSPLKNKLMEKLDKNFNAFFTLKVFFS